MSSDDIAISVRNLGKTYRLFGHPGDRIKQFLSLGMKKYHNEFTALHDVSFDIKKGETVGIIGRNGSGKSTLLQLICGILKPTTGTVKVNGRISALLELGAGFNPEFTGRENVYFQGAVMGFSKEEMDARFDEIAAFADIGEFVDQPVRVYSSGMFIRLAFSISSILNPDIFIIDEALAVGDLDFQSKCIKKMRWHQERGATIILVSHSDVQIREFCGKALWLNAGMLEYDGTSEEAVLLYRSFSTRKAGYPIKKIGLPENLENDYECKITDVAVMVKDTRPFNSLEVIVTFDIKKERQGNLSIGVAIFDQSGNYFFGPNTHVDEFNIPSSCGVHAVRYFIEKVPLSFGGYYIDVGMYAENELIRLDYFKKACEFFLTTSHFGNGSVYISHEWSLVNHV